MQVAVTAGDNFPPVFPLCSFLVCFALNFFFFVCAASGSSMNLFDGKHGAS